jgi:hypothetical protein
MQQLISLEKKRRHEEDEHVAFACDIMRHDEEAGGVGECALGSKTK